VGLGYVGLPLAVEFGKRQRTLGFDLSQAKVESYKRFVDPTGEVSSEDLRAARQLMDVAHELKSYGVDVHVHDPVPDAAEARHEYGLELEPWEALPRAEAVVLAVAHRQFLKRPLEDYLAKVVERGCFIDVMSQLDMAALQRAGLTVWRL
jgi:UDP-N-acetyl-D-mannosaminuronate dehydrogenase